MDKENEVFSIQARRCKRCGGLLTSEQAIRIGYGACCLRKMRKEEREKEESKDQITFFDDTGENREEDKDEN